MGFGAFQFMDENYAINEDRFAANLTVLRKEVSLSYDDFITEHYRKYSEPDLPPVWKNTGGYLYGHTFQTLFKFFGCYC